MKKYVKPQAARLRDATTAATMTCLDGPTGTADVCSSGYAVQPHNICNLGSQVSGRK